MPESGNFQFGFEHRLYLAVLAPDNDAAVAFDGRPGDAGVTKHYNNVNWLEYKNVRTVNVGGNSNSVDITTRDEARSGFATEVDVSTTGQMTFEVRYKPTDAAGDVQDPLFEALLKAWLNKAEIAAVDLDKTRTVPGAQGLAGNWTVSFSNQKEVQGVVIAQVTMKLSSYPNWIRATDNSGTAFAAIS